MVTPAQLCDKHLDIFKVLQKDCLCKGYAINLLLIRLNIDQESNNV